MASKMMLSLTFMLLATSAFAEERNARQDITVSGNFVFSLDQKVSDLEKKVMRLNLDSVPDLITEQIELAMLEKSADLARDLSTKEAERRAANDVAEIKALTAELVDVTKTDLEQSLDDALAKVADLEKKLDEQKKATEDANKASDKKLSDFIAKYGSVLDGLSTTHLGDSKIPVFRMAKFHTYSWGSPWMDNNNPEMFGGIHPSTWTDGNGIASNMDWSPAMLRKIFHMKGSGDKTGLTACAEAYAQRTSTNGFLCIVMFRIKNTKDTAVKFTTRWRYTAYTGWSERASVAMNKQNVWSGNCDSNNYCNRELSFDIPAGKTSTLIFSAPSGGTHCTYNTCFRTTYNAFNNLNLGDGLEFVDDLDTTTSLI